VARPIFTGLTKSYLILRKNGREGRNIAAETARDEYSGTALARSAQHVDEFDNLLIFLCLSIHNRLIQLIFTFLARYMRDTRQITEVSILAQLIGTLEAGAVY
jgi:hypothetical protein